MTYEQRCCDNCECFMERVRAEYGSEVYKELEEDRVPGAWETWVCNNDDCPKNQDFDRSRWEADKDE